MKNEEHGHFKAIFSALLSCNFEDDNAIHEYLSKYKLRNDIMLFI